MSSLRAYHAGPPTETHVPMHGGVAIWTPALGATGTVGGVVTRAGKYYLVTNQHGVSTLRSEVFSSGGNLKPSTKPFTIGSRFYMYAKSGGKANTSRHIAVVDPKTTIRKAGIDVALIEPSVPVTFDIPGIGIPPGHVKPRNGMRVMKIGEATGLTHGVIGGLPSNVRAGGLLKGSTLVVPASGSTFANAGDSGSFVVETASKRVVGVLYGAASINGKMWGAIHDADFLVKQFGISFAGRPGTFGTYIAHQPGTMEAPGATSPEPPTSTTTPTSPIPIPTTADQMIEIGGISIPLNNQTIMIGLGGLVLLYLLSRGKY